MADLPYRNASPMILGTWGTTGSPDNPQTPVGTPGPWGMGDAAQCSLSGAGVNAPPHESITLWKQRFIAQATDTYLDPKNAFPIHDPGIKDGKLLFGQDLKFGTHGAKRRDKTVGTDENDLQTKCRALVQAFAPDDDSGMAMRLMEAFLTKRHTVRLFEDDNMNEAIQRHPNFRKFSDLVLSAPGTSGAHRNRVRVHQALRQANWDINNIPFIDDLGVLAFNEGSKVRGTEDFARGLGLMINGVQYVLVYATAYFYDPSTGTYDLHLKFVMYDVFGLDDDDLDEYGADSTWNVSAAMTGITAWWQLQHQFGYAPLVTRAEVTRKFLNIPAV